MKEYQAPDIRNFAIVGHASAGKTMLAEAMLDIEKWHDWQYLAHVRNALKTICEMHQTNR